MGASSLQPFVHRQPPTVDVEVPAVVEAGPRELVVTLRDDEDLSAVTTWVGREKVAWRSLAGTKAVVRVPVDLSPGLHRIYVDVQDRDNTHTRQEVVVRATEAAVADEEAGPVGR